MLTVTEFREEFSLFMLICLEISTTAAYVKEYSENIAIQLCTILYNISHFDN